MSKVFRDFEKNHYMKQGLMVGIAGGIGILAIILVLILSSYEKSDVIEIDLFTPDKEMNSFETTEIQEKLDKIEKNVKDSENLETDYDPSRDREWITSGPFQIDRNEYALGESIFLRIGQLETTEKGQVAFLRPSNATHMSVYFTIPFDGQGQPFNQYFTPGLSKLLGICSIDDIAGEWTVVFRGTNYENVKFTISDKIFVPGTESNYESVC